MEVNVDEQRQGGRALRPWEKQRLGVTIRGEPSHPPVEQPARKKRRKGKQKERKKDPAKQRACCARWQKDLELLERLIELRGGHAGWKTRQHYALFAYLFLYHINYSHAAKEEKRQQLARQKLRAWLTARSIPARLANVAYYTATNPREDREGHTLRPYLYVRWPRRTIRSWLNVIEKEQALIEPKIKPSKRDLRLATVILLRQKFVRREGREPTIRRMQQLLEERGIRVSPMTVRADLRSLPR